MSQLSSFGSGGGGSGIITIDGDIGSVTGSTVSLKGNGASGAGSSVFFDGSGTAMSFNTTDSDNNTIIGLGSGNSGISGTNNTVLGQGSCSSYTTASQNVVIGSASLPLDATGINNVAIGYNAMANYVNSGSVGANIVIGMGAGSNYTGAEQGNVVISAQGTVGENNCIHIADSGPQAASKCFIGGIDGQDVGSVSNVVTVNGGQLGSALIRPGTGITVTPGSNTITIASSVSSGIATIDGDSGSVTGSTVSLTAGGAGQCGSSVEFTGSGTGMNLIVQDNFGNILFGQGTGNSGVSGNSNNGFGSQVMSNVTSGSSNVAVGAQALFSLQDGSNNTAMGLNSLTNLISGSNNVAYGINSGQNYTGSESGNTLFNNDGVVGDSQVLRIGGGSFSGPSTTTFITGIHGASVTGLAVMVNSSNQLGVTVSSARYKENIQDMGSLSSDIMKLRPVSFNYTTGEDKTQQTGLIAEEVDQVMPSLVVYDKSGMPESVKYHDLPALLLNEIQKLRKEVDELKRRLVCQDQ